MFNVSFGQAFAAIRAQYKNVESFGKAAAAAAASDDSSNSGDSSDSSATSNSAEAVHTRNKMRRISRRRRRLSSLLILLPSNLLAPRLQPLVEITRWQRSEGSNRSSPKSMGCTRLLYKKENKLSHERVASRMLIKCCKSLLPKLPFMGHSLPTRKTRPGT